VLDLRTEFGPDITTGLMLLDWPQWLGRLQAVADRPFARAVDIKRLRPLPPVQPVGQLFCAGANYHRHLAEIAFRTARRNPEDRRPDHVLREQARQVVDKHSRSGKPFIFSMPPSTVSGARDDVVLWGPGVHHDWELELVAVIGRPAWNVPVADALDYVAGYTISNDISTRDVMMREDIALTDFMMTKGRPGFFPTGPYLVPREFVNDYRKLRLTLRVNGETMQDEQVEDIIYGVEELVSHASHLTELRPGDLILTGSPGGNASQYGDRWLRPGDVIEGEISGLGTLRNVCVSEPR